MAHKSVGTPATYLHKYLYANADPINNIDPSGYVTMASVSVALNTQAVLSTVALANAGLAGFSIGSGAVAISDGRYKDGALDIALGFMGLGIGTTGVKIFQFTFGPVNNAIRNKYINFLATDIPRQVARMAKQGKTKQQIANAVVLMRNSIKMETRALMKTEGLTGQFVAKTLDVRNKLKYGHSLGPDVKWFLNNGKSYDDIVESALRSNDKINRLVGGAL